ncbi:MAG: hypothetical protein KF681_12380 [Bdellovibrionaceae bacterium]|nr:hypothetical protein [Pseudobdellovibrionaceae bacterium]
MEKAPFKHIIELSGLPEGEASDFLDQAFQKCGLDFQDGNLDDLRSVLADLLQDLILATEEH